MRKTKAGTAKRVTAPLKTGYGQARPMYEAGLSIQEVADFYQVTRQAMWDILKRRGTVMRPRAKFKEENNLYRGGKTASDRAQNVLEKAVQRGLIVRPLLCEKCGQPSVFKDGRSGIQAHHTDYNRPLDVMWLCQRCHHEWHKTNKAVPAAKG